MDMEQLLTKKAEELLKTEVVYCRNVRLLIEHYYKPLRALSYTKDKLLDPQETDTVFSNIEVIEKVATEMLQRLTERIEEEQSHRVGDIFCNLGFSLQVAALIPGGVTISNSTPLTHPVPTCSFTRSSSRTSGRPRPACTRRRAAARSPTGPTRPRSG